MTDRLGVKVRDNEGVRQVQLRFVVDTPTSGGPTVMHVTSRSAMDTILANLRAARDEAFPEGENDARPE